MFSGSETMLLRGKNSSDITFSTSHGVKVELWGCQSCQVRVLNEASGLGTVIVFDEVGQGALTETKGNPLTLNVLLSHTSNNLAGTRRYEF